MEEITKDIMIESPETLSKVFGKYDENIKLIEGRLKVDVLVRDSALKIIRALKIEGGCKGH